MDSERKPMKKLLKITGIVCLAIMNTFHFSCGKNSGNEFAMADAKHKNGFILAEGSRGYRLASFTKTSDPIDN